MEHTNLRAHNNGAPAPPLAWTGECPRRPANSYPFEDEPGDATADACAGWHVLEAVVAIAAGVVAGSFALVGFGADSVIEAAAGVVVLWLVTGGV